MGIVPLQVVEHTDGTIDYRSENYEEFYRQISSIDKYLICDQVFLRKNKYQIDGLEGERIEYVFPPNYKDNEKGSRKIS